MEMWETSLKNEEGNSFRWENTLKACDWLKERRIGIRGHYLSWVPWESWSEKLKGEPDKIRQRILTHIPRIAAAVGDRVMEWDAINHLAGWDKNIDEATGLGIFLIWGFWEGAHWKPQTALWRKDWREKPSAKVWKDLVNRDWATRAEGQTGGDGTWQASAHLGLYEITVTAGGKSSTMQATLGKGSAPVAVSLP